MIVFRGRGSSSHLDRLRSDDGLAIPIPGSAHKLVVVDSYKHLGGMLCCDGNIMREVAARSSASIQVYGPLACRLFGCNVVPTVLKLNFFEPLVLSRLFYNIHTLTMTTRALRKLNFNYMRPLRRIAGVPRHSAATCTVSDAEVRRRLGVQSVDSKVLQYRMRYYARLVAHRPVTLWAVLQSRPGGAPLPWVKQTIKDLCYVRDSSDMCKSLLPDPAVDSSFPWFATYA